MKKIFLPAILLMFLFCIIVLSLIFKVYRDANGKTVAAATDKDVEMAKQNTEEKTSEDTLVGVTGSGWKEYQAVSASMTIAGWNKNVRFAKTLDKSGNGVREAKENVKKALEEGVDYLYNNGYGVGSARTLEGIKGYIEWIKTDQNDYMTKVKKLAEDFIDLQNAANNGRQVYWQLGNEVDSRSASQNWLTYFEVRNPYEYHNKDMIPYFCEWYLGPTIKALENAEIAKGKQIKILLGSVTNANSQGADDWLSACLNYTFTNQTINPGLVGTTVKSHLDGATFHYLASKDFINDDSGDEFTCQDALKRIWDTIRNNIHGGMVWASEEVGGNSKIGAGAVSAFKVFSEYMYFISANRYTGNDIKFTYYGVNNGGLSSENPVLPLEECKVNTFMEYINSIINDNVELKCYSDSNVTLYSGDYDSVDSQAREYLFQTMNNQNTRIIMIRSVDGSKGFTFNKIVMSGQGIPRNANFSLKEAKIFKTAEKWGTQEPKITYSVASDEYTITFDTAITINKDASCMLSLKWN